MRIKRKTAADMTPGVWFKDNKGEFHVVLENPYGTKFTVDSYGLAHPHQAPLDEIVVSEEQDGYCGTADKLERGTFFVDTDGDINLVVRSGDRPATLCFTGEGNKAWVRPISLREIGVIKVLDPSELEVS